MVTVDPFQKAASFQYFNISFIFCLFLLLFCFMYVWYYYCRKALCDFFALEKMLDIYLHTESYLLTELS